ncbi:CCC motif membrane protein [Galbibacter sp. EGI 63066]|uniref:CCC motif membrane protein n=1 Tax=Galbibacter sp. EGI 63066 TaxID=2993559 RepID=UPI0022491AFD|nr:CCC motif membrane protein [Galbibacter sp. EGI 63066]MCX2680284.1 CCC motif membrane protein [Galbibacter sp. EGI 63066]
MEKQKLPNSTLILVFGILSIVTCCCYGIIGLILGIVALVMANKSLKLYASDPELYEGLKNVKAGRTMAIIGIILSAIYIIYVIYMYSTVGVEGLQEMQEKILEQYGGQ